MPSDNFSRPTAKKKLKRKPVTDTRPAASAIPGVKQVTEAKKRVASVPGVKAVKAASARTQAVPGVRKIVGTPKQTQAVRNAKSERPFDPVLVRQAIAAGLSSADGLSVREADGTILRKVKRSVLGVDSALNDLHVPLDPGSGLPRAEIYGVGANKKAGLDAAALKILDQTMRPSRAAIGALSKLDPTNATTSKFKPDPRGALKAAKEGLIDNKPASAGTMLKKAGLPKGVAGGLGFLIDVVADPTTYITFGAATVAKRAGQQAAEKTFTKALAKGMSEDGARTAARAAAKRAVDKAAPGKGLTVSFGGAQLPGVTRATATAGRGVKKVARKAPVKVKDAGAKTKDMARDVRPQLRPIDTPEEQFLDVRRAGRKARASVRTGMDEGLERARGVADRLDPADYEQVIAAIERGNLRSLPDRLHKTAKFLRDEFRHANRLRQRAGVPEGTIRNYFPHALKTKIEDGTATVESGLPGRTVDGPARKIKKTLADANAENRAKHGDDLFSTNVPLVYANYRQQTAKKVASAQLARDLAAAGEKVTPKIVGGKRVWALRDLKPGEALYHIGPEKGRYGLREVAPEDIGKFGGQGKGGQYVILNRKLATQQEQGLTHGVERSAIGSALDRGTSGFKRLATFSPGFHARNFYGDTQMAYLAQPGHRLPANMATTAKAIKRVSAGEVGQRTKLGRTGASPATIKIAGKPRDLDDFIRGARTNGVIRSAFIGRELEELRGLGKGTTTVSYRKLPKVISKRAKAANQAFNQAAARQGIATSDSITLRAEAKRWFQNREDWLRLATYKHGLDKGMTDGAAADLALSTHIDYGDLTHFERKVARRAMPFYTFSSRALPVHAKALVQKPGKYANIQKAREAVATGTGIDLKEEEGKLKEFQARQVPFIMKVGGKKVVLSMGLPVNLLNELPADGDVGGYLDELGNWMTSLANPILKNPVEWKTNFSFFFRSPIESEITPLVAAPDWAGKLYENAPGLAKKLGIVPDFIDKKSGEKVYGWPGKSDYFFKQFPGVVNFAQQVTTEGANRRGQTQGQKILSFVGGIKAEDLDPVGAAMEILFTRYEKVSVDAARFSRRDDSPANVRKLATLRAEQTEIERHLNGLSVERGDKQPLFPNSAGAASTVRVDTELSMLRARREQMKAAGEAIDEYGYYTKEWTALGRRISALDGRKKKLRKVKEEPTGRQRPLTAQESRDQRMAERLKRLEGADQEFEDRMNERMERLKILGGE